VSDPAQTFANLSSYSSISCAIPSSTLRKGTGPRSRRTSSRCTLPSPRPLRSTRSPSSPANGRNATRLS